MLAATGAGRFLPGRTTGRAAFQAECLSLLAEPTGAADLVSLLHDLVG